MCSPAESMKTAFRRSMTTSSRVRRTRVEFGRQPRGRQDVEFAGDLEDRYRRLLALRQAELDGSARTQ